jgi:Putative Actinobacterial Holin-X, holin superfamily III
MADQTTMSNGSKARIGAPLVEGVIGNVVDFSGDIAHLTELQAKLAINELKLCLRHAALPAVLVVVALLLFLGSVPVALFGVAEWVERTFTLSRSASLLATAGGTVVVTALLAVVGIARLRQSLHAFQYSPEEFNRNLNWVKTVLTRSGHVPARRTR